MRSKTAPLDVSPEFPRERLVPPNGYNQDDFRPLPAAPTERRCCRILHAASVTVRLMNP
jgi:hypothetical protein